MKAYELILRPGCWTQGCYARDKDDKQVSFPFTKDACKFCASGALLLVYSTTTAKRIINRFVDVYGKSPAYFNDKDELTAEYISEMLKPIEESVLEEINHDL